MKEKMFLSQVAFHSNLRALGVILLQMLLQSAFLPISLFFRYFRAKNPTIKERTLKGQISSLIFIYNTLITHFT